MSSITQKNKIQHLVSANPNLEDIEPLNLYRLLVQSVQDYAIFLLDKDGRVASWNAGAQKIKGYKAPEIIGRHFSVFYPKEDIKRDKPGRELMIVRQQGRIEDEGWRIKKDGTRFWANVVITALYDNHGNLQGYAKVTRDLTERKNTEDAIRKMNTALRKQRKELKKLNNSKDEFISLASHQLRTPASIVKQCLGLLTEGYAGELTEQQLDYLHKAEISNDRQIETVNDLLRVAQIDSGKVILNKKPTNLSELVHEVVEAQRDLFKKRSQTLTFSSPAARSIAIVDPKHLRMAFENLINNASKYTNSGGKVNIAVGTTKDYIRVSIADNGVGIKEEDLPKLFKQFSRIPNELSDIAGGSGLGLYWANKVIKLHSGYIEVRSELGKGTTFEVYLPDGSKRT